MRGREQLVRKVVVASEINPLEFFPGRGGELRFSS